MKTEPFNLLMLTGILIILASSILSNKSIDLYLYDTYYVTDLTFAFWILGTISLFTWALYLTTFKFLFSKKLTWTHIIITISTVLIIAAVLLLSANKAIITENTLEDLSAWKIAVEQQKLYNRIILILIGLLLSGKIIYLVNLITGIIKKLLNGTN